MKNTTDPGEKNSEGAVDGSAEKKADTGSENQTSDKSEGAEKSEGSDDLQKEETNKAAE